MNAHKAKATFTLAEFAVVIIVVVMLSGLIVMGYTPAQIRAAETTAQSELARVHHLLDDHFLTNNDYPPNLAGIDYTPNDDSVLALYTDLPTLRQYTSLTPEQNAQLLLNTCNALLPVRTGESSYYLYCNFRGSNLELKTTKSSTLVLQGPEIDRRDFSLSYSLCGEVCDAVELEIKNAFLAQGGTWPITVPDSQVGLPAPQVVPSAQATQYCLELRSTTYTNVVVHARSGKNEVTMGYCPTHSRLGYPAADQLR